MKSAEPYPYSTVDRSQCRSVSFRKKTYCLGWGPAVLSTAVSSFFWAKDLKAFLTVFRSLLTDLDNFDCENDQKFGTNSFNFFCADPIHRFHLCILTPPILPTF